MSSEPDYVIELGIFLSLLKMYSRSIIFTLPLRVLLMSRLQSSDRRDDFRGEYEGQDRYLEHGEMPTPYAYQHCI